MDDLQKCEACGGETDLTEVAIDGIHIEGDEIIGRVEYVYTCLECDHDTIIPDNDAEAVLRGAARLQ